MKMNQLTTINIIIVQKVIFRRSYFTAFHQLNGIKKAHSANKPSATTELQRTDDDDGRTDKIAECANAMPAAARGPRKTHLERTTNTRRARDERGPPAPPRW